MKIAAIFGLILALLFAAPNTSWAQKTGAEAALFKSLGKSAVAIDQKYGLVLAVVSDRDGFMKSWDNFEPHSGLAKISSLRAGEKVSLMMFFQGCVANTRGVCSLYVRYSFIGPDGIRRPAGEGTLWDAQYPVSKSMQFGKMVLDLEFNANDKPGTYIFIADVIDNVTDKKYTLSEAVSLIK